MNRQDAGLTAQEAMIAMHEGLDDIFGKGTGKTEFRQESLMLRAFERAIRKKRAAQKETKNEPDSVIFL